MGQVHCGTPSLFDIPVLGGELVGLVGRTVHLRRLYHKEDKVAVVENFRGPDTIYNELGGCFGIRPCGCLFHQFVLLPELCHSLKLFGKKPFDRRLPVRKQAELWPAHTANATHHAAHAAHHAGDKH